MAQTPEAKSEFLILEGVMGHAFLQEIAYVMLLIASRNLLNYQQVVLLGAIGVNLGVFIAAAALKMRKG